MDDFYQQISAACQHVAQLHQHARKSLLQQHQLVVEAFEELYAAFNELQIADEDLHQQNQELAAAREEIEVESYHYQNLFKSVPDAYLVTDMQGVILAPNRAAARLLNVPEHFLVGKPLSVFVPIEERRAFRTELWRLHQGNRRSELPLRLSPRGGEPIEAALTVTTLNRQQGRLSDLLGWLVRDITEHRQPESVLGLLRSGVQHANESIVLTSAELDEPGSRIVFVNPAFTKMTGYTMQEMTDKTPRILQGAKTERSVLDQLRRNLSQGKLFYGELTNYSKFGKEYKIEIFITPIRNESAEITHFLSIQHEITAQSLGTNP